jgi:hypothetical protein
VGVFVGVAVTVAVLVAVCVTVAVAVGVAVTRTMMDGSTTSRFSACHRSTQQRRPYE